MAITAKYVKDIVIQDPDTGGDVDITVFKHENGGMFGIDSSYIDQVVPEDCLGNPILNDPLADIDEYSTRVVLKWPEEEIKECTSNGTHLKSCDDDGFCNECGHQ